MWQEDPPTHDPEGPSYFIPNESASHKFIDPEEQKIKRKSQGKRKVNQDNSETPKKKKRTDATSAPPVGPVTPMTCTKPVGPVTPATCATPMTPATQKGRGKGKGKSSSPKTPSVVTPNPNDYGPLVPDAIEKALLETEIPNIVM